MALGLDGVEIVMAVEDEFQIVIPGSVSEQMDTVGKLVDYVCSRLEGADGERCRTQQGFFVVRRALLKSAGVRRDEIRPDTPLETLVPKDGRKEFWSRLQCALSVEPLDWPELIRPKYRLVKHFIRFPQSLDTVERTRDDVFSTIRDIVSKHLNLDPALVTMEANFIDDLGLS